LPVGTPVRKAIPGKGSFVLRQTGLSGSEKRFPSDTMVNIFICYQYFMPYDKAQSLFVF